MLACVTGKDNHVVAREVGVTRQTVGRWRARLLAKRLDGLLDEPRPGASRRITDAHVKDPLFIEKVRDIVGLYLHPPDRALVLCVDERTQIHALDRTQPLLPMRPGQAERRNSGH